MAAQRRHEEQVGGKRRRRLRREHVVLQHEVLRVRPVVRDLAGGVIPHDVRLAARTPLGLPALEDVGVVPASVADLLQRPDEPVHPRAVFVDRRAHQSVGTARVEPVRVVIGPSTDPGLGVGDAHVDVALRVPRESVRAGERAEVVIERAVLLHDHDDVGDVVDADVGIDRRIRGSHGCRRRHGRAPSGGHGSLSPRPPRAPDRPSTPQPRRSRRTQPRGWTGVVPRIERVACATGCYPLMCIEWNGQRGGSMEASFRAFRAWRSDE